ncbi:MAG: SEC-C domain-containing protein, partial [Fimbriimonadaceae bacterium]|nr:SEC-C domain-containing protein [Fimbriimonadaceae bacterium]
SLEDVSVYKIVNEVAKKMQVELHFTADKKNHTASMTEDGMDFAEKELGIDNIAADPKMFHHLNAAVQAYALFDKDIDYVVRSGEVVIVDENTGRMMFGRRYGNGLHQALEAKENVTVQRESQTVATITFQNLFRLYNKLAGMTGTAKTEEDEFRKIYGLDVVCVPTHRPMTRVDQADIVYKTLEAKFRGMGWEILRLYTKQQPVLVGSRSIEMSEKVSARLTSELLQKLVIAQRLRERVEVKKDLKGDLAKDARTIYETDLTDLQRGTLAAFLPKIELNADVLSGDWIDWCLEQWSLTAANRQYLEEALKHGIPHNILNAKFHEREALIIAEAGRKGQVTIATNMAGRGVDILLGGRVEDELVKQARGNVEVAHDGLDEYGETFASYRRGGKERAAPPLPLDDQERRAAAEEVRVLGGLFILGTERHESRRIDNQLRGRAGRQGDPGESRFFVALEDQLWKIFNANMMENPLLKAWPPMEEVNAGFLSKMISKTQERIENHFFEARKHVLEYDDVLNAQREHIYGLRREILLGKEVRSDLQKQIREMMGELVKNAWMVEEDGTNVYDYHILYEDLNEIFPLVDYASVTDLEQIEPGLELVHYVNDLALQAYERKVADTGDDIMRMVEQQVMLRAVNDHWMTHLQIVEYIRDGIGLRGYGQVDPLVAYKRETYDLFQHTLTNIRDQAVRMIYRAQVQREPEPTVAVDEPMMMRLEDEYPNEPVNTGIPGTYPGALTTPRRPGDSAMGTVDVANVDWKRVGRNDPCPCGSGKKFKSCHYPQLRAQGVI